MAVRLDFLTTSRHCWTARGEDTHDDSKDCKIEAPQDNVVAFAAW